MSLSKPWRDAATLILTTAAKAAAKPDTNSALSKMSSCFDFSVLMLKRSSKSSFMPNAYVFPGGVAAKADFSKEWYELFKSHGVHKDDLSQAAMSASKNRPLMMKSANVEEEIERDLAFRLTAVRETFEESGILLAVGDKPLGSDNASSKAHHFSSAEDQVSWRKKVHGDPKFFMELYKNIGKTPDLLSLREWSAWLTPVDLGEKGNRRFDTVFYVANMDETPEVHIDKTEVTKVEFTDPASILDTFYNRKIWLAPPQVYELSRLLNFKTQADLARFIRLRQGRGTTSWLPVRVRCEDGTISLLPGDSMYPTEPDYLGDQNTGPQTFDGTLKDHEAVSEELNRLVFHELYDCQPAVTAKPAHGQVAPLSFVKFKKEQFGEVEENQCGKCSDEQVRFCHRQTHFEWEDSFNRRDLVKFRNKRGIDKFTQRCSSQT